MPHRLAEISALVAALLLVLSATAPGMVAGVGASAGGQSPALSTTTADNFVPADSFLNASQNVSVWERAGLPLRINTENAATTIEGVNTEISSDETGSVPLNKRTIGVFETGSTISLEFEERTGAGTDQFNGQTVQLVAARVSDNPDTSNLNESASNEAMNLTTSEALERLLSQNRTASQVNRNFTFTVADSGEIQNGAITTEFEPNEPGTYAFMLVTSESGGEAVSETNGNLSLTDDAEILGVDAAPVQSATASATPSDDTIAPGENVTFDLDSNLADEQTGHAVMVYNESVLSDQTITIDVEGDLDAFVENSIDGNVSGDDVSIDHSIDAVDGVAQIEDGTNVMGVTLENRTEQRTVSLPGLIEFLANESGQEAPETISTGDVVLNASVSTALTEGNQAELDVGTTANWTEGSYTYVYIATNETGDFSTDKGEVTVENISEPEPELDEVQLNLTANRTDVEVNESVELTVTRPDGTPVSDFQLSVNGYMFRSDGDIINFSSGVPLRFGAAGNYTVTASKPATDTEEFLNDSVEITVEAPEPDDGDGGPPAGGGGGGGQQGGGEPNGEAESIATNNGATVNFRSTRSGTPISVQVPNVASDNSAVTGVELTTRFSESNFRVEFTKPQADPPSGTPELDPSQGEAVEYFTAEAIGINDDEIDEVNFTFTLSEERLGDRSPDDVRLFRNVNGEWTTLETTHLGGNQFRARSPGFTVYAIGFQAEQQATETATPTVTATPTPSDGGTATATPTETVTDTDTPGGDGGGGLGVIVLVLIILVALGAGAYLYARNQDLV